MKICKPLMLLLFQLPFYMFAQNTIQGVVTDSLNNPLFGANILLHEVESDSLLDFAYSDENGKYLVNVESSEPVRLVCSSFGFKKISLTLNLNTLDFSQSINFSLAEDVNILDEVFIESERTINIKKDTIVVKANRFLGDKDIAVEDLLRKIPGVTVSEEGTIKIEGKEIEKLMIDGSDFFKKGYKILSKNMPPTEIDKIELLKNYSDNKLLKGIEDSDKVAMNLVLKDDANRNWFGEIGLGADTENLDRHSLNSYLMNFGKKSKYVFISNLNNIGFDSTGDLDKFIRPANVNATQGIDNVNSAYGFINNSNFIPYLSSYRTNDNKSELISLNSIISITDAIRFKNSILLNWNKRKFRRLVEQEFFLSQNESITREDLSNTDDNYRAIGIMSFEADLSKKSLLEFESKYSIAKASNHSNIILNTSQIENNIDEKSEFFETLFKYTNKITEKEALSVKVKSSGESFPQNFNSNNDIFSDFFNRTNSSNNVSQKNLNKFNYYGIEASYYKRSKSGNLLEVKGVHEFRRDSLYSTFNLSDPAENNQATTEFQNSSMLDAVNTDLTFSYLINGKNMSIRSFLDIRRIDIEYNDFLLEKERNEEVLILPRLDFDWRINKKNKLKLSYFKNSSQSKITNIYNNYILTDYRNFNRGTQNAQILKSDNTVLAYSLGNFNDKFFANAIASYTHDNQYFTSSSIVNNEFSISDVFVSESRDELTLFADANRYLPFIRTNLKIETSIVTSKYMNIVNNNLRDISTVYGDLGFELRSGFQSFFNVHLGSNWSYGKITSSFNSEYLNNTSFLEFSFEFDNNLSFELYSEAYKFDNVEDNKRYYFTDFKARYKFKKNKIRLDLSAINIFNNKSFQTISLNDVNRSTNEYRIIPRYILLSLNYRF